MANTQLLRKSGHASPPPAGKTTARLLVEIRATLAATRESQRPLGVAIQNIHEMTRGLLRRDQHA